MKRLLIFLMAWYSMESSRAQNSPFQIFLEPASIKGLSGIQSFAFGQHTGEWLIIGGRIDGLHRRQPWATFNPDGQNRQLTVVNPETGEIWRAPLTSLPLPLQDQLSSTNMEFHQEEKILYLAGGYGHSETVGSKITYAMLTAVDVPGTIAAIKKGENLAPYFRFMTDVKFAVSGGHLNKINDTYYLVGGHKFDGNYNPMNHATFTQEYTNAIRTFHLEDNGQTLNVAHLSTMTDTLAFHRRDYNVAAQILPGEQEGLMSFSGPFQVNADLPYLNVVSIDAQSYQIIPDFAQYFNNYHCAVMPVYSSASREMHTIFFGGIAQHYMSDGQLVQDSDVPFVKTIARVTRDADGKLTEYILPKEMPGYLGAGAEFIPDKQIPQFNNGVILLDALDSDTTLVGYIYGGIESSAANIFWINDGAESTAHPVAYKLHIIRNQTTAMDGINAQSNNGLQLQIYPNPNNGIFTIAFQVKNSSSVKLTISDDNGKIISLEDITGQVHTGFNKIERKIQPFRIGGIYFVTLHIDGTSATQKILVKE